MYRTFVILRHTFYEASVQPIYPLLIGLGVAILIIFALLPFFTFGEDTLMFKSVGLDVILILVLLSTLFATSKSIFDEIEDRTMLTLMSKPVQKWEVLVGKYLGIILSALMAVAILGLVFVLCAWWRIPGDYGIRTVTVDEQELQRLSDMRWMHIAGIVPSLLLAWLQISVLAAISVAISTRVSLVVNLPVVIILYIAGNLTRFLFPLEGQSALYKAVAWTLSLILPYLENFDLRQLTIYRSIKTAEPWISDPNAVSLGAIWSFMGGATVYAIAYTALALSVGLLLFHNRELGGSEG
jgi:ABC-type transport system involved in multi-copper enzyme maturation permease subunit